MQKIYKTEDGYEVKVSLRKKGVSTAMLGDTHYVYTIIIEAGGLKYSGTFHDSVMNYRRDRKPDIDGAFECVIGDYTAYENNPTFSDFCDAFGYDYTDDAVEARRVFNGCRSTYERLHDMLGDYIYELNEMVVGA